MIRNLGLTEILIIALVLMVFFGPKKLTELTRSLGKAGQEFGKGLRGEAKIKTTKGGGDNV